MTGRRGSFTITGVLIATLLGTAPVYARGEEILVSAAASLTNAMYRIGGEFTRSNPGAVVRFNFGASGALQKQIENGAPADVFASAGGKEMDSLARGGFIDSATRLDFAGNQIALIVPKSSPVKSWEELAGPAVRRIALSNPDSVPSGRYAREILRKRALWNPARAKAVFGHNVRQTLAYVARGDADAGFVFASDALIERNRVRIVRSARPGEDPPIIAYPAAVVTHTRHAALAKRFVAYLRSREPQAILTQAGFTHPPAARPR